MARSKTISRRDKNLTDIRTRATPLAEKILLEEGTEALNARRLASELEISVGSLYNAFGDLEAIYRAVGTKSTEILSNHLYQALETCRPDRRSRLIALGEAYFDFAVTERQRWWLVFERRSYVRPDVKAEEYQEALLEMLIKAGEGDARLDRHRQIFLLLWSSVHGLVSLASRPSIVAIDPHGARRYIGVLVDAGLNALKASDQATLH